MAVTTEILRSWKAPREGMRRQLGDGVREDRALAYLMLACLLIFVGQWPRLARAAQLDPGVPLQARIVGALFGWLFVAPLLLYGLAAVSHLVARATGGRGSFFAARLALFWALLVATPLWLVHGLAAGLLGSGPALSAIGSAVLIGTLAIWGLSLAEAERPRGA